MKVKKYIAATMPDVMKKIRAELGSDAVILNSKEVQSGGLFGLFKKSQIEVVAAVDPNPLKRRQESTGRQPELEQEIRAKQIQPKTDNVVLDEIKQMKRILETQSQHLQVNYAPNYQIVYQYLLDQEVEQELATEIINAILSVHGETNKSLEQIISDVKTELKRRLEGLSFEGVSNDSKVVHFIGPTGVGKTTTLAKIAAECMLKDQKKVAFITMDTYRIAAIDQLKTYAQILDVPIKVAYSFEEYKQAINEFSAYDLILVDTAGRNFRDKKYIDEITPLMKYETDHQSYLVLSLTAKPKDLLEIYDQFSDLRIGQVIFTKMDETTQFGSMLNIALQKQTGIAYITNGQDVPSDLIQPSPNQISNYVMDGCYNE